MLKWYIINEVIYIVRHLSLLRSLMQFWDLPWLRSTTFTIRLQVVCEGKWRMFPSSEVLHLAWKAGANAALSPCKVCFNFRSSPIRTEVCDSTSEPWVGHEFSVVSMLRLSELKSSKDARAFLSPTFTYTCHEPHHLVSTIVHSTSQAKIIPP